MDNCDLLHEENICSCYVNVCELQHLTVYWHNSVVNFFYSLLIALEVSSTRGTIIIFVGNNDYNYNNAVAYACIVSINKVPRIVSPVLVIHGTEDEVIDFTHGLAIYERCPRALAPLWIEGAGHNDIELYSQYLDRLKRLINVDLTPKCPQTDLM